MKPLKFYGSKVNKDPQEFIEGIKKITETMGVTLVESALIHHNQILYHLNLVNLLRSWVSP